LAVLRSGGRSGRHACAAAVAAAGVPKGSAPLARNRIGRGPRRHGACPTPSRVVIPPDPEPGSGGRLTQLIRTPNIEAMDPAPDIDATREQAALGLEQLASLIRARSWRPPHGPALPPTQAA